MRILKVAAPAAILVAAGCILTSGQITISFPLQDPLLVTNTSPVFSEIVDLNTIGDYADHKDKLESLSDAALLGEVTNNSSVDVTATAYFTRDTTPVLATPVDVANNAIKLWGPFTIAAGATRLIGWDESAALIDDAGRDALIEEIKGDGVFRAYIVGPTGIFSFTVNKPTLVLTLDAGV